LRAQTPSTNGLQPSEHLNRTMTRQLSLGELEQEIQRAATAIGPFDSTFEHCGYTVDGGRWGLLILYYNNVRPDNGIAVVVVVVGVYSYYNNVVVNNK